MVVREEENTRERERERHKYGCIFMSIAYFIINFEDLFIAILENVY